MVLTGLGLLAALLFVAGPAGAADDEGNGNGPGNGEEECEHPCANDGSVISGDAHADDDSTASGSSSAHDGSVASGGLPEDDNGDNGDNGHHEKNGDHKKHERVKHAPVHHGGVVHEAGVARPVGVGGGHLALTGSSTGPLVATAAGLVIVGLALLSATSDRRRATQPLS